MNQTNNISSENSNTPLANADSDLNPVSLRQKVVESDGKNGTTNIRYRKNIKKYKTWRVDTNRATLDLHGGKYTNTTALKNISKAR
jgi:hypothetical protein